MPTRRFINRETMNVNAAWLTLALAGLTAKQQRQFLQQCGDPTLFFAQADKSWRAQVLRLFGDDAGRLILQKIDAVDAGQVDRTLSWAEESGNHLLMNASAATQIEQAAETPSDRSRAEYPAKLLALSDAPLILYGKGDLGWLQCPGLALVGSRSASAYGERLAEDFAEELARAGMAVISGLALGVDAAAHRGALRANGATIAVLGTGPNIIYPPKNRALAKHIAERGLILSEFPLDTAPRPHHFPRRNRIIAALSLGTLVVEASEKSGALITARMAAELNREVFAIPGSVHSPMSRGPHRLLREGAKLVERTQDILEELQGALVGYVRAMQAVTEDADKPCPPPSTPENNTPAVQDSAIHPSRPHQNPLPPMVSSHSEGNLDMHVLLKAIPYSPMLLDDIVAKSGLALPLVHGWLLDLEMAGSIESLPGGRFQRLK